MAIFDLKANIDLKQNLNLYTTCKQLDSLNLILSVFDNSAQADLANYNVRLKAMKADKVPLIQEHSGVSISSNVITIETDEQLTTTSGKILIELQFIDKETGKKKATFNLVLIVVSTTLEVDRSISKATYTLLEELENKLDKTSDYFANIEKIEKLNNEMKGNITSGTTLDTSLKANITSGTTLDTSLKDSITKGNTANDDLKTTTEESKTSKSQLDESIKKANDFVTNHGDISQLSERVTKAESDISQLSNPNLLINGDFQVWQRGLTFTNLQPSYTADRWKYTNWNATTSKEQGTIEKTSDGIKISDFADQSYLTQTFEQDTYEKLSEQTVTASVMVKGENLAKGSLFIQFGYKAEGEGINQRKIISYKDITNNYKVFTFTYKLPKGLTALDISVGSFESEDLGGVFNNDAIINIKYIKLEIGEKATPLTPRQYAEELVLCQRYYQTCVAGGVANTTNCLAIISRLPTIMRITPTISYIANASIHQHGQGRVGSVEDITESSCTADRVDFITTREGYFKESKAYNVEGILLDAEIY